MVCANCGCPLTEGFSNFCPECGTPVKNNKKPISPLVFRIILGIFIFVSAFWIIFPVIRAGGDKITSLSALDIVIGKKNFDGMKISALPYLALVIILPQIICAIPLFIKKLNIHKTYSFIGVFEIYYGIVLLGTWITLIAVSSFSKGIYGYGYGIVFNLTATLLIAFLCISLSASQESQEISRSECWLITLSRFNLVLLSLSAIGVVASFVLLKMFREQWICSLTLLLSFLSGALAYFKIMKNEFNQWLLIPIHAVLTLIAQGFLILGSNTLIKNFVGEIDFLDMYGFIAPYIYLIVSVITVFALIYNVSLSIWAYKTLKRHKKICKTRRIVN